MRQAGAAPASIVDRMADVSSIAVPLSWSPAVPWSSSVPSSSSAPSSLCQAVAALTASPGDTDAAGRSDRSPAGKSYALAGHPRLLKRGRGSVKSQSLPITPPPIRREPESIIGSRRVLRPPGRSMVNEKYAVARKQLIALWLRCVIAPSRGESATSPDRSMPFSSRPVPRGISRCRSRSRRAGDRAEPYSSSPS
jgi:hypothetical protein